jgi:hypothetical protein
VTIPAHSGAGTRQQCDVDADLGTTQAAEILLSLIGAGTVEAVGLLIIDTLHLKTLVQTIPRGGFIGMNNRALNDAGADE